MRDLVAAVLVMLTFAAGPIGAETLRYFPAAASAAGAGDSFFVTDARIFNPDPEKTITVRLAYLRRNTDNTNAMEVAVDVPPRTSVALDDMVRTVFGIEGAGGVRLRSDDSFDASSRTYNQGGEAGTFGQFIPGSAPDDALTDGILLSIANDPSDGGSRSNVGFANPFSSSTTVRVEVYDSISGELLGSRSTSLPPLAVFQINDVFNWVGVPAEVTNNATVEFRSDLPVLAYASVLDNTSSDPIYILAFADRGSDGAGNNPPVASILTPTNNVSISAGESVSFAGSVGDPDGDAVTFQWDFGDGISSDELSPGDHTFSDAGEYDVVFTATDGHGLESALPAVLRVTVTEMMTATLTMVQEQIFDPSCAQSGCHLGSTPPEGLNLADGFSYQMTVDTPSTQQPDKDRIEPFSPEDSYLWLKVTGDSSISGGSMPRGGLPPLDEDELALLRAWIEDGAQDN